MKMRKLGMHQKHFYHKPWCKAWVNMEFLSFFLKGEAKGLKKITLFYSLLTSLDLGLRLWFSVSNKPGGKSWHIQKRVCGWCCPQDRALVLPCRQYQADRILARERVGTSGREEIQAR